MKLVGAYGGYYITTVSVCHHNVLLIYFTTWLQNKSRKIVSVQVIITVWPQKWALSSLVEQSHDHEKLRKALTNQPLYHLSRSGNGSMDRRQRATVFPPTGGESRLKSSLSHTECCVLWAAWPGLLYFSIRIDSLHLCNFSQVWYWLDQRSVPCNPSTLDRKHLTFGVSIRLSIHLALFIGLISSFAVGFTSK